MVPHLIYHTAFVMDDGSKPDLTVGKEYELTCVFKDAGRYDENMVAGNVLAYQILNDRYSVHTFHDDEEWFSKHFTVVGDIDSVMEEV